MSVERISMEAAIEYAKQLERQVKAQDDEIDSVRQQNSELRRQINAVKQATRDFDRPQPEAMCNQEVSMPMASRPDPGPSHQRCCKNCGCPV